MVPVPSALKQLVWIVLPLPREELAHLWIASLHLILPRPAVICQVVAAAMCDPEIDQIAEGVVRRLDRLRRVVDVQVEDDARVAVARPGQERLVVSFDHPDRAVNDVRAALPQ